ncbi:hypothetical protein SCHPADRAFT_946216 [Schizopora paradoxa]|uniref:Uncharacterized protein n=1 Tax=Schizopora paradoxa TaxID=27342 RepID=A0A0H2RN70_9AGAM|nr:hypothetical protein SCHPADRAFT_946216 [Schizopora paradoxa]
MKSHHGKSKGQQVNASLANGSASEDTNAYTLGVAPITRKKVAVTKERQMQELTADGPKAYDSLMLHVLENTNDYHCSDSQGWLRYRTSFNPDKRKRLGSHQEGMNPNNHVELASYSWKNNSCWLDTSVQLLSQCILRDFASFEELLDAPGDPPHSVGQTLLRHFRFRKELLEGNYTPMEMCSRLNEARDMVRSSLVEWGVVKDMASHESLFVWLASLIKGSNLQFPAVRMTYNVASCFVPHYISVRTCDGGTRHPAHQQIDCTPWPIESVVLPDELHLVYEGDAAKLVGDQVCANRIPDVSPHCWRNNPDISPDYCNGSASSLRVWTSFPLCLRLELPERSESPAYLVWKFPDSIPLVGLELDGREVECFYDIVGCAYFSPSSHHFTCTVADVNGRWYYYDDGSNGGLLTPVASCEPLAFGGEVYNLTIGQQRRRTVAAVYNLRGGVLDQERMLRKIRADLLKFHNISITKPTSRISPFALSLDPELTALCVTRVVWMKDPIACSSIDYDGVPVPRVPNKKSNKRQGNFDQYR